MSNVTPIQPKTPRQSIGAITDKVIRAKQIIRAVRFAKEHCDADFDYATEQAEDLLEEVQGALNPYEDDQTRSHAQVLNPPEDGES